IDTLGEGLNGAVADAVREAVTLAVQQAVEVVVREVLARPEVLRQVAPQPAPAPTPDASPAAPANPSRVKRLIGWVCQKVRAARTWCGTRLRALGRRARDGVCSTGSWVKQKALGLWESVLGLPETV